MIAGMADIKIVGGTEGFERDFRERDRCEKGRHKDRRECTQLAVRIKLR